MTFDSTIADQDVWQVGFYVKFAGIATRLAEHDFAADFAPGFALAGVFDPSMIEDSIKVGEESLDLMRGIVQPADFSFAVHDTAAVRSIFRRRGGIETQLVNSLTLSNSQLTLGLTTLANETVYCDRETIVLGAHLGAGLYQISTRAAYDSDPQGHRAGQVVSTAPRHMMERRATLVAVLLDTGETKDVRTGVLTSPPVSDDGQVNVTLTDLQTVLNRPLLAGWPEVSIEADKIDQVQIGALQGLRFTVPDIRAFTQMPGINTSYIKITAGGKSAIVQTEELFGVNRFEVKWPGFRIAGDLDATAREMADGTAGEITLRQVWVFRERVGHVALEAMLSDFGDGANHATWDVLPGRSPALTPSTGDLAARRIGAGIPSSLVDVDAFLQIPGPRLVTFLDEQKSLLDFLTEELTWRSGGMIYVNGSGQISWKQWATAVPRAGVASLTVDGDTLEANVTSWDDESKIIGRATIQANYIPGERGFTKRLDLQFSDLSEIYGNAQAAIKLRSKSLWMGAQPPGQIVSPSESENSLATYLDRVRSVDALGGRRIKRRVPLSVSPVTKIADVFSYSDSRIPDHAGGIGSSLNYQVIASAPDYSGGESLITAREIQRGYLVAPSVFVDSWDGGTLTFTIAVGGADAELWDKLTATPGLDFAALYRLRIFRSVDTWATVDVQTVVAVTNATIRIGAAPPFVPAQHDLLVLTDAIPGDSGNLNQFQADVEDYAFGAAANGTVGGGTRTGPTWG